MKDLNEVDNVEPRYVSLCERLKRIKMPTTIALCAHLAVLVLTALVINTWAAPITCEAGTYVVGKPASVTCNFRTNVSAANKSFNMARYPSDSKKGEIGADVLVCHWLDNSKKHDCHASDGYAFNGVITDRVTVEIPNATDSYKGLYMCFFVPAQESDAHACEFLVEVQSTANVTVPNIPPEEDEKIKNIVIAVGVTVLVLFICIVLGIWCAISKKKQSQDKAKNPLISPTNKEIKKRLKCLKLSKQLDEVLRIVQQEIHSGLDRATQQQTDESPPPAADLKMYPMPCPRLDQPVGDYLAVDFGSKRIEVFDVRFRKQGTSKIPPKCYPVKNDIRTSDQLFNFIVESVDSFVRDVVPHAEKRNAVLIVPFPCQHKCLDKATLVKWTQEFSCERVTDDLRDLLRKALNAKKIGKKPCTVKFVAIVNDVVSTVVSVAHQNPDCRIGLVVGSGLNACYVESWRHATDDNSREQDNTTIYNTEVGALGDNRCLEEFRTDYDRDLDKSSSAPGNQTLEKMVSWTYIGELVRLVLKHLRTDELLLKSVPLSCKLFQKGCLTADHVAEIDSETEINISSGPEARSETKSNSDVPADTGADKRSSAEGNNDEEKARTPTERILGELEAGQCTEEDLTTVRNVCRLVCDRAAHLVGTVLASLVNHQNQTGVVIVVDGELFREVPRFHGLLYETTNRLVKSELKNKFYLVTSFGRGNVGAARIAAAAVRQNQASGTSQAQDQTEITQTKS